MSTNQEGLNESLLQHDSSVQQQVILLDTSQETSNNGGLFSNLQGTNYSANQFIADSTPQNTYYNNYPSENEYVSIKTEEDLSKLLFIIGLLLGIPSLIFPLAFVLCNCISFSVHGYNYYVHAFKIRHPASRAKEYGKASFVMIMIQLAFAILFTILFVLIFISTLVALINTRF